jgi:putative membrane protein
MPIGGTPSLSAARVATPFVPQARAATAIALQILHCISAAYGTAAADILDVPGESTCTSFTLRTMNLIIKLLINAAALWVAAALVSGIELEGTFWEIMLVALIFGLINTFIKPVLKLLSLPVMILTLGLFAIVINAGLLWFTAWITDYLTVQNFWSAILGAIVISIVSALLGVFVRD